MSAVARCIRVAAPPEQVFAFVADYRNTLRFMAYLTRFEPLDGRHYGLGSRFRWEARAKGVPLRAQFVVTEFAPPVRMAATTTDGPPSACAWTFEPIAEGTLATLETTFTIPALPVVAQVGAWVIEQEIAAAIEQSLRSLRACFAAPRSQPTLAVSV
ncbi:MAG: SRPBCC family protein [Dehalococcoidia bacterium]|nr:SRPBCC family protein [Dehalococcoidia bacterium]